MKALTLKEGCPNSKNGHQMPMLAPWRLSPPTLDEVGRVKHGEKPLVPKAVWLLISLTEIYLVHFTCPCKWMRIFIFEKKNKRY